MLSDFSSWFHETGLRPGRADVPSTDLVEELTDTDQTDSADMTDPERGSKRRDQSGPVSETALNRRRSSGKDADHAPAAMTAKRPSEKEDAFGGESRKVRPAAG